MRRLTRDGTAEFVSRNQFVRRERGQGNQLTTSREVLTVEYTSTEIKRDELQSFVCLLQKGLMYDEASFGKSIESKDNCQCSHLNLLTNQKV